MSDYQFFIDGHELAVGDYVIDEDDDVCVITDIRDGGSVWHIKWISDAFSMFYPGHTAALSYGWAECVQRLARPEEIVMAKLKGLVL